MELNKHKFENSQEVTSCCRDFAQLEAPQLMKNFTIE